MGVQLGLVLGRERGRSVRWSKPDSGFAMLALFAISEVGLPITSQDGERDWRAT